MDEADEPTETNLLDVRSVLAVLKSFQVELSGSGMWPRGRRWRDQATPFGMIRSR